MDDRPPSHINDPAPQNPCMICGRTFFPDALVRHERICEKSQNKKPRKVFNTAKQRLQGTEMEQFQQTAKSRPADSPPKNKEVPIHDPKKKQNNWRAKHEEFISAIRNAREVTVAMKTGAPLPPPPPPAENPDYVKCDFCGRRFKEQAAERHIPFCREKAQRLPGGKPPGAKAKEKLQKRNSYRAPLPGSKKQGPPAGEHATASQPSSYGATSIPGPGNRSAAPPRDEASRVGRQPQPRNGAAPAAKSGIPRTRPPAGPPSERPPAGSRAARGMSEQPSQSRVRSTQQRVPGRDSTRSGTRAEDYPASPAPPQQQTPAFSSRRTQPQRRGSFGTPGRARGGMNSTYTIHQNGTGSEEAEHGQSYSRSTSRATARHQVDTPEYGGYEPEEDYQAQAYSNHGTLGRTLSSSGVSMSEVSLPVVQPGPSAITTAPLSQRTAQSNGNGGAMVKFCYNCGTQYPVPHAKYCCECGTKRIMLQ